MPTKNFSTPTENDYSGILACRQAGVCKLNKYKK